MTRLEIVRPISIEEIEDEMIRTVSPENQAAVTRQPSLVSTTRRGGIVDASELIKLDAPRFVEALYIQILGREPDERGLQHHIHMLASGADRQNLIIGFRQGAEGAAYNSTLIGLEPRGRFERLFAMPLVGPSFRRVFARLPSFRLRQHVRNLEESLAVLRHMASSQEALLTELTERQQDTASKNQVDALSARLDAERTSINNQKKAAELAIRRQVETALDQLSLEPWAEPLLLLADRQDSMAGAIDKLDKALSDAELLNDAIRIVATAFAPMAKKQGWSETGASLVARSAEALRLQESRIHRAEEVASEARAVVREQERRLSLLLETVRRRSEPLDPSQLTVISDQQDHLLDPLYVDFEARFRGSRSLIKERQRVHLAPVRDAGAGMPDRPIIDVGAGRGEWLELLKDEGLMARGIDLNASMARSCRLADLDCVEGDAVEKLAELAEHSVGAVTGFHIIEHLPFRVLVALFDEAFRVLAPGGLVLFETPNPANLLVGSRWFYLDPTHKNPLPAEMVAMIAEARGFVRVRIQPLHPMDVKFDAADTALGAQLDALFHGPMDYALIAYKA